MDPDLDPSTPRRVPPELDGQRLDRILTELFPGRSRAAWQKAVRRGEVLLDGTPLRRSNISLRRGQRLSLAEPIEESPPKRPAIEPVVIYADDDLVVIDKPAGWLTHPADRADGPDLVRFAADRYGPLPVDDDSGLDRAGIVHRLDRHTSGVIVVARTVSSLGHLRDQFRARSVRKRYLALVSGAPSSQRFEVRLPLRPSRGQADLQLTGEHPSAKAALTRFELVRRLGPASLLECSPETGRRHQIRAHLAAVDLPVVGDPLYRPTAQEREQLKLVGVALPRGRHALHAASLELEHPATGRAVRFEAPLPDDLATTIERLEAGA